MFKRKEKRKQLGGGGGGGGEKNYCCFTFSLFQCRNSHSLVTFFGREPCLLFCLPTALFNPLQLHVLEQNKLYENCQPQFCLEFVKRCCRKVSVD